jgi:phage anti-repressor protein
MSKKNKNRNQPSMEYFLTIDAAKEIAMMSETQKAKEIRQYFIEIEKAYYERKGQKAPETVEELFAAAAALIAK